MGDSFDDMEFLSHLAEEWEERRAKYWVTGTGKEIRYESLTDRHLINIVNKFGAYVTAGIYREVTRRKLL